ncbi:arrestin domain-containing protein 2-like [Cloeon dipterum]|uniref:arrestin domain-containing protein 2-like n=1 Tax=Cloeon dipterum TaxID=197152 RepID=UPI00321FADB7
MERVQIHFEGSENTFYSGQYVSGHVSVHLDVPTRLRAITLRISGTAEVKWEEWIHKRNPQKQLRRASQRSANGLPQQAPPSNEMKLFKSNELYFEYKIALLAASNHDPMFEAREYKFPFHFNLPQNIPSSFEGQFGHVRYVVCCKVDKPCARDHEAKTMFTVICPLDLNRFPHLATMADASDVRKFWCLFHRSKPTTVIMRLSESGIVPEQLINPNIDVDNTSDVRINQVRLMLIMSCSYTAMGVKKVEKTVLVESHLGAVEPKKARSWFRGIFIQVPPVPPSGLNNCTLIDITYKLKLVAEPERPHLNITVSLPLTVGTIPFRNNFDPSTPLPSAPPSIEPLIGTRLLTEPPSYEESINSQGSPDYLEIQPSQGFLPPLYPSLPLPPEIIQDTVKEPPPA